VAALQPQKFIKFGQATATPQFDILCHARATKKHGHGDYNWPLPNWEQLISKLERYRIGSIGTEDGAYHIPGTADLRGLKLKALCDILASSRILVGPSSGPMHLGSLCGTPHIVWSGVKKSKSRYEIEWNPFCTPVRMLMKWGWQPGVADILEEIEKYALVGHWSFQREKLEQLAG